MNPDMKVPTGSFKAERRSGYVRIKEKAFMRLMEEEVKQATDQELLNAYEDFASVNPCYRDDQDEQLIVMVRAELMFRLGKE